MTIKNDISFRFSENDLRNGADVIMIINLPVRCKIISVRIYRKNLQTQKKKIDIKNISTYIFYSNHFVHFTDQFFLDSKNNNGVSIHTTTVLYNYAQLYCLHDQIKSDCK